MADIPFNLAHDLMEKYGLIEKGWKFAIDRAKMRCGQCDYGNKVISLSKHYVRDPSVPQSDIRNTILHEIAHALVGDEAAHGPIWKATAIAIGCDGKTTNSIWSGVSSRYKITCNCGALHVYRHNLTKKFKRFVCAKCRTVEVSRLHKSRKNA